MKEVLETAYQSDEFWTILMQSSIQAGPFDGGCLTCAKAILRAVGAGSLVRIVSNGSVTEHYGALINGQIVDFSGVYVAPQEWIASIAEQEMFGSKIRTFAMGLDEHSRIPYDLSAEKAISSLLVRLIDDQQVTMSPGSGDSTDQPSLNP